MFSGTRFGPSHRLTRHQLADTARGAPQEEGQMIAGHAGASVPISPGETPSLTTSPQETAQP